MISVSQQIEINTWIPANWDEFIALANHSTYAEGRFYYDRGYLKIEMSPLGSSHSQDDPVVSRVVSLYATFRNIRIKELKNASFRRSGLQECQPDIAFYIGTEFQFPPRNNAPINIDEYGAPTLVIEIAATSKTDDLGEKRLLYERLGVREYWVVDVNGGRIFAFEISGGKSGTIQTSLVLPGLEIALVEEALKRSQSEDDGTINRWLIQVFS